MTTANCPGCGAPVAAGTEFCTYCGTALPIGPSAPLPSSPVLTGPPTGLPQPVPAFEGVPVGRRRRSRWLLVIGVILVVVVIAVAAYLILLSRAPPIQVVDINIWAPNNVCGLGANAIYFSGFNGSTGANETIEFGMPNYNATVCTIRGVVTNTTGFTLYHPQVPLSIPGHSTVSMNLTIRAPGSRFSGNLNLVLR